MCGNVDHQARSPGIFWTDCVTYAPAITCGDENFGKRSGFLIT